MTTRFAALSVFALLAAGQVSPAAADGGRGGNPDNGSDTGGTVGIDDATGVGGSGGNGTGNFAGGGGGGAGAVTGGAGGFNFSGFPGGGQGGAGGVHGSVDTDMPAGASTGTNGGAGTQGGGTSGGGGGGAGGYGAVVTGTGTTGTVSAVITGGAGGAGGAAVADYGGSGGSGGIGLLFTDGSSTTTLTVDGTIQGGNGGARGTGGQGVGSHGAGGAGIVGSNLSIIINGTVSGGLSGDGVTHADAIRFTDGTNSLTFGNATSGLTGNIAIQSGWLIFDQPTDVTIANGITGAGSIETTGAGKITLTGTSSIEGDLTLCGCSGSTFEINGGSFSVGDPAGVSGAGGVYVGSTLRVVNGGTLTLRDPSSGLVVLSTLEVVGTGSSVSVEGITAVGGFDAASVTISAGGAMSSKSGAFIDGFAEPATVTVTGTGSSWTVDNGLFIGGSSGGTGAVVISAGGVVNSTAFTWIGSDPDPLFGLETASVTVTGAGSTLNADNGLRIGYPGCGCGDYAGALTVAAGGAVNAAAGVEIGTLGTLNFGVGGLAGSLSTPTIANDGHIVADFTDSATLAADISGLGTLTKRGSGTLTLTGANSYTGTTFLNGGVLSVSSDANLGDPTSTLALDGGTLRITGTGFIQTGRPITFGAAGGGFDIADPANSFTLTQSLSGTGSLLKAGAGTLVLTGANTYSGGTTISAGTLVGDTTSLQGAIVNDAALVFDQAAGGSFAGRVSGTGTLTKQGAGVLTLTGANTYSGATHVTAGTLQAGAAGALSASSAFTIDAGARLALGAGQSIGSLVGAGSVDLGSAQLTVGGSNASTLFSGVMSGTGSLVKDGTGALTLTGANTYSGGTTIGAGTLMGSTTSLQGPILNNAALVFDQAGTGTFAGTISGTGALTKQGGGALNLTGANSYSGGTTISAGTLIGNTASLQGAIVNNAALAFDQSSAGTFAGVISGAGTLTKQGAGALTLTGANTYSGGTAISGGTLIGNTASLQGAILNNAALIFDQASAGTFAGAISGGGSLAKQGSGALTLTGASPLSGPTTVTAGLLTVNGSLANSVVTLAGGTLGGSGTVGGVVASAGTVAPGNSIGTLSVAGNVSFAAGSTYQVELNGSGGSDRIAVTGAATLSGGQVQVVAASGAYAQSTRYGILTAQGGVSGQFGSVTSDLAFLTPSLSYDSNAVVLTMTRNDTDFGPQPGPRAFVAATRNQAGVATAAQALGTGNRVYDSLLGTTAEQARAGFDLLSGEAHAQAISVAIEDSHLIRETILNRLRAPFGAAALGGNVQGSFTGDLPGRASVAAMPAPAFETRRVTVWGEAIGAQGSTDRDGNAGSMSRRGGGMLLGAELEQGQWRLGAAGGYTKTDFDLDARRSDGEVSSVHGALYGGARFGSIALRAGAAYAWSDVDIRRQVSFPGFADYLRLDGRSATAQAFAEIGYGLTLGPVALEPFAQIAAVTIRSEREAEQGGAAALQVLGRDQRLGFTTLGLRAEMQLGALPLVARGMLGWRYAFGDTTPTADLAFVSGGLPFQTYATPIARNSLLAEAGLAWKVSNATTLGLSYSAAMSDRAWDQALRGRIDIAF